MKKFTKTVVIAVSAGVLTGALGFLTSGTAAADTIRCSDARSANTNGNLSNDVAQQGNKLIGSVVDAATCTTMQTSNGLNGADNAA
ncbi:hypothetical protein SNS2_0419 [Streptomyces netropsis]|uniref:HAMP domain-containing protein n=1 Tax=Streptomyces syringium TaxID=76729 RepID=A0ABS4XZA9_9ACTN|nr:hypothetical protein [Streptomyces syringium]MBP2401845.1 HAMP domain-containing protein [Streptomyces syringium]SPE48334.1 hypothetical protein SNS2_0419 [Streptomyces netropsis]